MRWLKVIGVNEDKNSGENLVNERVVLLLEEERILQILSVIKLRYSSGEKEGGGEFLWWSLDKKDHLFLELEKKNNRLPQIGRMLIKE